MPLFSIDPITLKRWLDSDEALAIDVREPGEHRSSAIAGSTLLPLASVRTASLPAAGGKKLVVHCQSGKRGSMACETLLAEDPALDIYHLEGGIDAWQRAGLPLQQTGRTLLPLQRQVQLTIGCVVFLSISLGYFVHSAFLLAGAVFGLGLMNAGLTGWCGLALLMARMPWNQR